MTELIETPEGQEPDFNVAFKARAENEVVVRQIAIGMVPSMYIEWELDEQDNIIVRVDAGGVPREDLADFVAVTAHALRVAATNLENLPEADADAESGSSE